MDKTCAAAAAAMFAQDFSVEQVLDALNESYRFAEEALGEEGNQNKLQSRTTTN